VKVEYVWNFKNLYPLQASATHELPASPWTDSNIAMTSLPEPGLLLTTPKDGKDNPLVSLDRHGYLFGKKIANSLSPYLHSVIYKDLGLNWAQVRLDSDDVDAFLQLIQHPRFYGGSDNQ